VVNHGLKKTFAVAFKKENFNLRPHLGFFSTDVRSEELLNGLELHLAVVILTLLKNSDRKSLAEEVSVAG
jgi:hypothetical protein